MPCRNFAGAPWGAASYGLQLILEVICHGATRDANPLVIQKPCPCRAVAHICPAGIAPVPKGAASYGLRLIHAKRKGDHPTAGGAYRIRTGAISLEGRDATATSMRHVGAPRFPGGRPFTRQPPKLKKEKRCMGMAPMEGKVGFEPATSGCACRYASKSTSRPYRRHGWRQEIQSLGIFAFFREPHIMLPFVNSVVSPVNDHQLILSRSGHRAVFRVESQTADDLHFLQGRHFPLCHGQFRWLRPVNVPRVKKSSATPLTATVVENQSGKCST